MHDAFGRVQVPVLDFLFSAEKCVNANQPTHVFLACNLLVITSGCNFSKYLYSTRQPLERDETILRYEVCAT